MTQRKARRVMALVHRSGCASGLQWIGTEKRTGLPCDCDYDKRVAAQAKRKLEKGLQSRRCEVVEDHSGRNAVLTEGGEKIFLATLWSPRYPIGTKGTIEYKRGPSYGIYMFTPEEEQS